MHVKLCSLRSVHADVAPEHTTVEIPDTDPIAQLLDREDVTEVTVRRQTSSNQLRIEQYKKA